MRNATCKECGDVYPIVNESKTPGFCYKCEPDKDTTFHESVLKTLTTNLGYTEEQAHELIHALSPRWTLSAVRMAFHEKPELMYLVVEGARRVIRPGQKYYKPEAEASIYEGFRQIGWIIPETAKLHAYLKCAWLAFLYRAEGPYRNCQCLECHHEWIEQVRLSNATCNISGEASIWCPECKTKNVLASPRS